MSAKGLKKFLLVIFFFTGPTPPPPPPFRKKEAIVKTKKKLKKNWSYFLDRLQFLASSVWLFLCLNSHAASAFSASQNHNPPPSLCHSLPGTNCFRSFFRPFLPPICVSVFPSSTYFFEMILGFRISIFYFCK
jgi:hypothetical protein